MADAGLPSCQTLCLYARLRHKHALTAAKRGEKEWNMERGDCYRGRFVGKQIDVVR